MEYKSLKKRYVGLDVLRVVSVLVICAFHTLIHLGANYGVLQGLVQMGGGIYDSLLYAIWIFAFC